MQQNKQLKSLEARRHNAHSIMLPLYVSLMIQKRILSARS